MTLGISGFTLFLPAELEATSRARRLRARRATPELGDGKRP